MRQSFSLPASTNLPSAATAARLHRLEQEDVGSPCRLGGGGDEEVGAVEVDRVDLLELDEPADLDAARRVVLLDRLEIRVLDEHELALRDLETAHELVACDLPVVNRAPALLLDRRLTLAVQHPEGHVGLARGRSRRGRKPDRDVDEAEAD